LEKPVHRVHPASAAWLVVAFICALALPHAGTTQVRSAGVVSEFTWDAEGWEVWGNTVAWRYDPDGVLVGGGSESGPWYWSAPEPFLGDHRAALGSALSYVLHDNVRRGPRAEGSAVILAGNGVRLGCAKPREAEDGEWTVFTAELRPGFWRNLESGEAATEQELAAVLSGLDRLLIRGTRHANAREGRLTRVILHRERISAPRARVPTVKVGTKSLRFGDVALGDKATKSASMLNMGTEGVGVTITLESEAPAGTFLIDGNTSGVIPPDLVIPIVVDFHPTTDGDHNGTIKIALEGRPKPILIKLSGRGVEPIQVSPGFKNYGRRNVGAKVSSKFKITNKVNKPVYVKTVVEGGDAEHFTHDEETGYRLTYNRSFSTYVIYEPITTGEHTSTLVITAYDSEDQEVGRKEIALRGQATGGVPKLTMDPAPLSFGTTVPFVSVVRHHTLSNVGNGELRINLPAFLPAPYEWLGVFPDPLVIPPHESRDLDVVYNPINAGSHARSFTFDTNDPAQRTFTVQLQGAATVSGQLLFDPDEVDFGTTASPFTEQTFEIVNSSAVFVAVSVEQPLDEWDEWDCRLPEGFNGILEPLESVTVTVWFTPQLQGDRSTTTRVRGYLAGVGALELSYDIPLLGTYQVPGPGVTPRKKSARPDKPRRPRAQPKGAPSAVKR